jgi:PAS domain S-box-containing protein
MSGKSKKVTPTQMRAPRRSARRPSVTPEHVSEVRSLSESNVPIENAIVPSYGHARTPGPDVKRADFERLHNDLALARDRYRELYDSMQVGHLVLDALGFVVVANLAVAAQLGRERDAIVGRKLASFMAPDDAQVFRQHRLYVFRSRAPASCDVAFVLPDGGTLPVRLDSVFASGSGAPECRTTVTEIGEHRRIEQSRRLQAVGAVAVGIAHDFNNLLTGILAFAENCLSQVGPEHPTHERMQEILSAALTGATLVKQLMSLGSQRPERGDAVPFDPTLRALAPMLQRLIGEQASLRVELAAPDMFVVCEPGQIEQILLNLVINAREAMPRGGNIDVQSSVLRLNAGDAERNGVTPGDYVRLEVRDDGVGMDAYTLARACEPSFSTKLAERGSGLGLATVGAITRGARGRIELRSERGRGTQVIVLLPAHHAPEHARVAGTVASAGPRGTETVLLVEDDPLVRAAAREHLERAGYCVISAASGQDALDESEKHPGTIDLVLTDIVLGGGMLGIELAEKLRERTPQLAVAFMSAYPTRTLLREGRLSPGNTSLEKPFTRESLLRHVRSILDE